MKHIACYLISLYYIIIVLNYLCFNTRSWNVKRIVYLKNMIIT
jgi:hypothetical protein